MKTTTIAITLALALGAGAARADSVGGRPDERSAIRHAESVVAGAFTGAISRLVREQRNAIDAEGRAYTAKLELVAYEFAVSEHLDGAPTPATISIVVPGALTVPAPRRRIVVGVRAEGAAPADGYNLLYGRALEADTDARLAQLRDWVTEVRAPAPVHPQAIVEAVGMHEAEERPDDPVPGGAIGPDDPDGPARPSAGGPPRSAPLAIEPLGDPRHPAEGEVLAVTDAADVGPGAPWVAPARRAGSEVRAVGAGTSPSSSGGGPRWPFAVVAVLVLALAALAVFAAFALRRRRAAAVAAAVAAARRRR